MLLPLIYAKAGHFVPGESPGFRNVKDKTECQEIGKFKDSKKHIIRKVIQFRSKWGFWCSYIRKLANCLLAFLRTFVFFTWVILVFWLLLLISICSFWFGTSLYRLWFKASLCRFWFRASLCRFWIMVICCLWFRWNDSYLHMFCGWVTFTVTNGQNDIIAASLGEFMGWILFRGSFGLVSKVPLPGGCTCRFISELDFQRLNTTCFISIKGCNRWSVSVEVCWMCILCRLYIFFKFITRERRGSRIPRPSG